jgi:RNA polymerase sigma-70 factor (ECF subfamily)
MKSGQEVSELLTRWEEGDQSALNALIPVVYDELRRLARRRLARERTDHTLQTTALVHEAYLRLLGQRTAHFQNRSHFFAVAAQVMRRVLVDHARRRRAGKRGGGEIKLKLDEATAFERKSELDLLQLDDALNRLAESDAQQSKVVELRFFGGLSIDETSKVLGVSAATVKRDWTTARAWLHREIRRSERDGSGAVGAS